jgi:hypothetical protein
MLSIALVTLVGCSAYHSSEAAEYFVSPSGSANGDGSSARPWSLPVALSQPGTVGAGDTIWLQGGVYDNGRIPGVGGSPLDNDSYVSDLTGAPDNPITVSAVPGERVTIDGSIMVRGTWTEYWGFEVTNLAQWRPYTSGSLSDEDRDATSNGIVVRAPYNKFINLIVHDVSGSGLAVWREAIGTEVYGCLIYNNGISKFEHGIYTNGSETGTKVLADNIIWGNSSLGITLHTSSGDSPIKGYLLEGNVVYNNGFMYDRSRNLDIGQGRAIEQVTLLNNFTYEPKTDRIDVKLDYGPESKNVTIQGNYFAGFQKWSPANVYSNVFVGPSIIGQLEGYVPNIPWDGNAYYSRENPGRPFGLEADGDAKPMTFDQWKAATGFDANSRFASGRPTTAHVFVRPNLYEPGQAHLIVYNWTQQASVDVDLSPVPGLSPEESGTRYVVRNAQDYFGPPVASGVYDGTPIRIPLNGLTVAQTIGNSPIKANPTGPDFNTFIFEALLDPEEPFTPPVEAPPVDPGIPVDDGGFPDVGGTPVVGVPPVDAGAPVDGGTGGDGTVTGDGLNHREGYVTRDLPGNEFKMLSLRGRSFRVRCRKESRRLSRRDRVYVVGRFANSRKELFIAERVRIVQDH